MNKEFTKADLIKVEPSRKEMIGACEEYCSSQHCPKNCILYGIENCEFDVYSDEELKECYEKVMKECE